MATSNDLLIKQRSVIEFLAAEGCSAANIHARMKTVYGEMCISDCAVRKWVRIFQGEDLRETILRDRKLSGQPSYSVSQSLAIAKLQNMDNVQIPIVELEVDPTGSYSNLVSLVRFDRSFRTAGGVNLPKIITCIGSDGFKRTTLVKGRDDLRQDAVMQQVFSLVNQLLTTDQDARQRQLSIRTYKVIPLSQKSGLLQWCDGTMPLGDYLAGRGDAHSRYNPHDWKVIDCRKKIQGAGSLQEERLKAYQEICAHFHPVFRHFFLERFVEPDHWFERRLTYTRSVATNSIVGYILGLGDRHVNNILIDVETAELVHIDFGIAFEQGRILPTPETVPFRLTRDIVDGMGIPGVEGVFRRCCEKMVQVMKNNSEALLTIVQVLLHDPLSHWSLSPDEALALQRKREQAAMDTVDMTLSGQVPSSGMVTQSGQAGHGDTGVAPNENKEKRNKVAERTLLRVRQKLSGEEDGVPLSVSGQVNLLIQKATDPKNLCRLFHGWQAYL
ncbi:serine/threonine-protein kinase atm [Plakobranchus ocellatus]|uniref:non-specific serine/threonine protein kinase n=1 Tax=Plakobranchus ocellatus TaxID=259542 RepID=A0AAV4B7S3_9GAST|nr:serine/threonine-protein kinase atm [Plakobranchus ocellatus]